ncbi:MAG TPA: carbamate kinase [Tepidisphaeraceae bacterium]|jgi:carbamate kinase
MLIVVALGGNAVSLPNTEGNIPQQYAATRAVMKPVADLIVKGERLILVHGNGPQIGQVMRRVEIAAQHKVYPLPLDIAVADTQAGMGYMISQCLMNELNHRGSPRLCATVVTTVRVDPNDSAFEKPNKPVGSFMTRELAEAHVINDRWKVAEDKARGQWRRVVPSPLPKEIVELPLLKTLVDANQIVVAAGGGGIPVMRDDNGDYIGVEAVIDKDRTSAIVGIELNADMLAILTNVDQVQKDYGKPTAQSLARLTLTEAVQLKAENQFSPGSMLPKIEAAIYFLENSSNPKAEVLITSCERFHDGFAGKTGTRIVRD